MAIAKLPTNYVDEVVSGTRKYTMTENQDNTVSFTDVSTYTTEGSGYGATDINATNGTVNDVIDLAEDNASDIVSIEADIAGIKNGSIVVGSATAADTATNATTATRATSAGSANDDFILINKQTLTFTNNVCTLSDARITADSLADVYFTAETISAAQKAVIAVETAAGSVTLTAGRTPDSTISATIRIKKI